MNGIIYNQQPYSDYTNYQPVNTAYEVSKYQALFDVSQMLIEKVCQNTISKVKQFKNLKHTQSFFPTIVSGNCLKKYFLSRKKRVQQQG